MAADPLLLADLPWLLYRGFFSLPKSILGSAGKPVNALLGTVNALLNAAEVCRPRAIVACFGAEQAAYRVRLYPPYHAHRDPMPPELRWQWQRAPELLAALGWTVHDSEDLEADDVMGSFAQVEASSDPPTRRALLVTGDRDMFQAVNDRVAILELKKGAGGGRGPIEIGPAEVRERYGVDPTQVPDFIALRGDPSDGLPGGPGIGAKTAAALLNRHGSLEAVLAAAESGSPLSPRHAATLRHHAEELRTFKQIATLVPIDVEPPPDRPTDFSQGARVAREMGMEGLAARLEKTAA